MIYVPIWWAALLVLGAGFLPLTNSMFRNFRDHGWIFSKMIGLFLSAWLTWTLNVTGAVPFRQEYILIVCGVLILANYLCRILIRRGVRAGEDDGADVMSRHSGADSVGFVDRSTVRLIVLEEILFFLLMLGWMWIVGFRPEAYGTEKFMDYGFLTAMARSDYMPFEDLWYAGEAVNYYYGGQFVTAWLMKLTGTPAGIAYNVMRALVTAASFILPFSLAFQLMYDRINVNAGRRLGKAIGLHVGVGRSGAGNEESEGVLRSARRAHRVLWKQGKKELMREARENAQHFLADEEQRELEEALMFAANPGLETARREEAGQDTEERAGENGSSRSNARQGRKRRRSLVEARRKAGGAARDPAALPSIFTGLLAGIATAFCGTGHYVIYGFFKPLAAMLQGTAYSYWFPDSTRYIGYDPDLPDKTIHEYPAYSSVLGDLHAHYLNILFVITVAAIVYAWAQKQDRRDRRPLPMFAPEILLIGVMTGGFRWTNYWDFPIYFVVCGSILFFVNLRTYRGEFFKFLGVMASEAVVMFAAGYAAALPFILNFRMISSEIAFTYSHTMFYQLLIIWGLPMIILISYAVTLIREQRHMKKTSKKSLWNARRISLPDLTVLLFGLCAAGLVAMPEVIYVKDIYGGEHYRANTMFKLSYQAFILFAVVMAYVLVRAFVVNRRESFEAEFRTDAGADFGLATMLEAADIAAKSALLQSEESPILSGSSGEEESHRIVLTEQEEAETGVAPRDTEGVETGLSAAVKHFFGGRKRREDTVRPPRERYRFEEVKGEPETEKEIAEQEDADAEEMFRSIQQTARERSKKSAFAMVGKKHRKRDRIRRAKIAAAGVGILCLLLTAGYTPTAVSSWFGDVTDASARVSDDASVFVREYYPTDVGGINWLITNASDGSVVLEASGDSYSDYERVSVASGLPTVAGWYVHEWLWRGDTAALDARIADIERIYTSDSAEEVSALIEKYNISYIYIGALEREKYSNLQDRLLQSLGTVVYSDGVTTYIMKVS